MESDDMIIRCLHCGTKNRIPRERLQDRPTCGRCKAALDDMLIRCLHCGTKNRMPEDRLNGNPLCGRCGSPLVMKGSVGHPVDVTDGTFTREVLESSPASVLVDCWAPWCGPCRSVSPILDDLAARYAGAVKVAKLNVDDNPLTASRYRVQSIPTLLFFKDGRLVQTLVGALPKEEIERHLVSIMKTN